MFDDRMVIRFLDGTVLKAFGDNFLPSDERIMVTECDGPMRTIELAAVKMVCFVKQFVTDSQNTHRPPPPLIYQAIPGSKVRMEFTDGEVLMGIATLEAAPSRGFFVTPLNPNSNNLQIYVNPKALKRFRFE